MADLTLYIATGQSPLSSRFQEMLDMLLTGAAFGQPTALWLTDGCIASLTLADHDDGLINLADFGVRCLASEQALQAHPGLPLPVEPMDSDTLAALRTQAREIRVF
ncbi:MAG: hypothetical protein R3292_11290 [Alcanivorax sp.]|nr:hypothetical protein [Alcanivorax sp.]